MVDKIGVMEFIDILKSYGVKVRPNGVLFCPFHPNDKTPAAKLYGDSIYCFFEHRRFTVLDFLRLYHSDDEIFKLYGVGVDKRILSKDEKLMLLKFIKESDYKYESFIDLNVFLNFIKNEYENFISGLKCFNL